MSLALILLTLLADLSGEWKSYTNANFVNHLTGTEETLYLATNGGLQLFGIRDTTFLDAYTSSEGLPANTLLCCDMDDSGNVWLGTDGGGIVIFNPRSRQFSVYPPDRLSILKFNCLRIAGDTVLVGSENGAWLISTRGTYLNFEDDDCVYLSGLLSPTVLSLGADAGFWIGTNRGIDRVARDLTVEHFPRPLGDSVKGITVKDDTLFIATEWGIARFEEALNGFQPVALFTQPHPVYDLAAFNHLLYLVLDAGLWRCNGTGFETVWWTDCRSLLARSALWIGFGGPVPLLGSGIGRYGSDGSQARFAASGPASNMIASAVLDSAGNIYADHYLTYGGFRKLSRRQATGNWDTFLDTLVHAWSIARDRRNRIWFGHWGISGGLSGYDPATGLWQAYQWGPADMRNVIAGFGIDRNDTKWAFSQAGQVVAIDSNEQQEFFRVPGVVAPTSHGYDFAFDAQERVWFGTMNGLALLDYRGTLHDQSDDSTAVFVQGLQSPNVVSVAVDDRGRPWVGTSQGAGVLESGTFRLYTTLNSGILSNNVARVRVDARGNVWFLTDRGLSVYDPGARHWSQPGGNRGLIPNLNGRAGFYTWLELDEARRTALIGTQGGLSVFTYEVPPETSLAAIAIYPNPVTADQVTFDRLPDSTNLVQIYTLTGELVVNSRSAAHLAVNTMAHRASWDLRNWNDKAVASGIYLLAVTTPTRRAIRRFAVAR